MRAKMKQILFFITTPLLVVATFFYVVPYVYMLTGGTFLWGNKMIYKGEVLFEKDNCVITMTDDFSNIKLRCPNEKVITWIDGVETPKELK